MSAPDMHAVWGRNVTQRQQPEKQFHYTTMEYLDLALPIGAIAHHSPGEGKRTKAAQADLKRSGYQTGWPDIEIIYKGRAYFIELKAANGYVRPSQREMWRRLEYAEAPVCLCRTLPEVEAALREMNIPLRASVMDARPMRVSGGVA